jgi:ketosteroid isomerase-like protein
MTLPVADAATTASVRDWLIRFAAHVRAVDYAAARPFWHEDIVIFGTYQELVRSRDAWQVTQWDNVWPRTADFAFTLDAVLVLASADGGTAVAVAPWTSTGFHADGTRFDRPGRATLMLVRGGPEGWVGMHSHMSLGKGVPQDSFGQRPVAAP